MYIKTLAGHALFVGIRSIDSNEDIVAAQILRAQGKLVRKFDWPSGHLISLVEF